jgi:hypothetical protein
MDEIYGKYITDLRYRVLSSGLKSSDFAYLLQVKPSRVERWLAWRVENTPTRARIMPIKYLFMFEKIFMALDLPYYDMWEKKIK